MQKECGDEDVETTTLGDLHSFISVVADFDA
jgi:hypothetical protein